jgi:hypothetical protein
MPALESTSATHGFAALLRYALASGDTRPLAQGWIAGVRPPAHAPFDVSSALQAAREQAVPGILTGDQTRLARATQDFDPAQLRAASAGAFSLLGRTSVSDDAHLTRLANNHAGFAPQLDPELLTYLPAILATLRPRADADGGGKLLCLTNFAHETQLVPVPWRRVLGSANVRDLVSGVRLAVHGPSFEMRAYDVRWLVV